MITRWYVTWKPKPRDKGGPTGRYVSRLNIVPYDSEKEARERAESVAQDTHYTDVRCLDEAAFFRAFPQEERHYRRR